MTTDLTVRAALDIATRYAFEFAHTDETRAALAKLESELARGSWAPRWVRAMRAGVETLSALR